MSLLFGGKKGSGKTVALVDIESGSVASALARLSPREAPKLFAETRITLPILKTRDANALAREVERAVQAALLHTSAVAARMRAHENVASLGNVSRATLFFSPPWASMHLIGGTADFVDPLQKSTHLTVRSIFGEIPTTFHPFGTAAAHGSLILLPNQDPVLLCIVSGEVTEILIVSPTALLGRATVPVGSHTIFRTLMSHADMSHAEVKSYLSLPRHEGNMLYESQLTGENFVAEKIADAIQSLQGSLKLSGIVVLAAEDTAEQFAQALARQNDLAEIFPEGGTVRALHASHAMPFIGAHASSPDLNLMLEALFVDAKFSV